MLNKKALAASVSAPPAEYVEDVFSTYLYTGTGTTQTITNNIDLAGKGGMVWTKTRSGSENHWVYSTAQGTGGTGLITNTTDSSSAYSNYNNMSSFNADGFTLGTASAGNQSNPNGKTAVSWTFRKAKKFFDVVTYTGNGSSSQTIAHNLDSQPGFILLKKTSGTSDWQAFARKDATNYSFVQLNLDGAQLGNVAQSDLATSSVVKVGWLRDVWLDFNTNGQTYIAYVFAHNAGGFGAAGTDNIITCGSYTGNGSSTGPVIDLGYEPQWVIQKRVDLDSNWHIQDVMRGMPVTGNTALILPNSSTTEYNGIGLYLSPTATGFQIRNTDPAYNANGGTYIYMAIRRPMKTPTSGTEVFSPTYVSAVVTGTKSTTNFPIDLQILSYATGTTENQTFVDRLRGVSTNATESGSYLISSSTAAEATSPAETRFWDNTGFQQHSYFSGGAARYWNFRRATGFFDVVCYTGTGTATTVTHNLGVVPELIIVKQRNSTNPWRVYSSPTLATTHLALNTDASTTTSSANWNDTVPTSSVFTVGTGTGVNGSGNTYVAYLFASLNGVSKVGSYTGNGSNQTINCGFSAGARFVLIKRTDSTGDWYVFDTARGIVSGNDPFLLLNSTAAEVTTRDAVDPDNSGFIVNNDATNFPINVNNATYIYLAIA